ncbi:MAG: right-handed parallel beta-helix repeat-containing protein [Planctomycetota bacterium]
MKTNNKSMSTLSRLNALMLSAFLIICLAPITVRSAVIYVHSAAVGSNNGTSWFNAYTSLQTALSASVSGDQIWVATGTYKPTTGTSRTAAFNMKTGVALYGGFGGFESSIDERNVVRYPTILSGDLNDDDSGLTNNTENSNHVVVGADSARLDGFTIVGGNANSSSTTGGGVYCYSTAPTIINCIFKYNSASLRGGGIYSYNGAPQIKNCVFWSNNCTSVGGGISLWTSTASIINCSFYGNTAGNGGGISNQISANSVVVNSILWGNTATVAGPNIYNTATITVSYSDIEGSWAGTGNISTNPNFYDAAGGDLHLNSASICIDRANSAVAETTDIDGNIRCDDPTFANNGVGTYAYYDIGAYEFVKVWYVNDDAAGLNNGRTWTDAYTSLKSAITASLTGNQIWVARGTYSSYASSVLDTFTLKDNVAVYGGFYGTEGTLSARANPPSYVSTLDGASQSERVIVGANTVLDGFVIQNGKSISGSTYFSGAGLYVASKKMTIRYCSFRTNTAYDDGGAIYMSNADGSVISNCSFYDNSATGSGTHYGGAIRFTSTTATMHTCVFLRNSAKYGGALYVNSEPVNITNCIFADNTAEGYGGAVFQSSTGAITHCTFYGNDALTGGGALYVSALTTISNTIFWSNTSPSSPYIYAGAAPTLNNCDTQTTWTGAGSGNISSDPLLVDPNNDDYSLDYGSPCRDAGSALYSTFEDINGKPRFGAPDIGACELRLLFVKKNASGLNNGTSWTNAFTEMRNATAGSIIGDSIWVAAGTYTPDAAVTTVYFTMKSSQKWYGGFAGTETLLTQRNPAVNLTRLSGDLLGNDQPNFVNYSDNSGRVVTGATSATIDGFTVQGGNGQAGAGIYASASSMTIKNCVITLNLNSSNGGGVYLRSSLVEDCVISSNRGSNGGGIYIPVGNNPTLNNIEFRSNTATSEGGAVYNGSTVTLKNCVFDSNTAATGGAVRNEMTTTFGDTFYVTFRNCTFYGNTATGSCINSMESTSLIGTTRVNNYLYNCIIWGNSGTALISQTVNCTYTVNYSDYQGVGGGTNINSNPLFVDAAGHNLRLQYGSPCIDAGDHSSGPVADIDGVSRFDVSSIANTGPSGGYKDLGAYEHVSYSIRGRVTGALTTGVAINLTGASTASATTDISGNYAFNGLNPGSYVVTPSFFDYSFSPVSRSVTITTADVASQNFTSTQNSHVISGVISGDIVSGVTVTLSGAASNTMTTGAGGSYSFTVYSGNYTVTPSITGYSFTPADQDVTVSGASVPNQNFVSTINTYTLDGSVTLSGDRTDTTNVVLNVYKSGVSVHTYVLNVTGNYVINNIEYGSSYSFVLEYPEYDFTVSLPTPNTFDMASNQTINITAESVLRTYTISGTVSLTGDWTESNGVQLTLMQGATPVDTQSLNASGAYSFTNIPAGTYTFELSYPEYTFNITTPAGATVVVSGETVQTINATTTLITYTLDGSVVLSGALLWTTGVELRLMNGAVQVDSLILDVTGAYVFSTVPAGTYQYKLVYLDYGFAITTPVGNTVTVAANKTQTVLATTVSGAYDISGSVALSGELTDATGITLNLFDQATSTLFDSMILPASGAFVFNAVPNGLYRLELSFPQYSFSYTGGDTLTILGSNISGHTLSASATLLRYAISGVVALNGDLTDTDGVTLRLMNGAVETSSQILTSSGDYAFSNIPAGTYSFILESLDYSFLISYPIGNSVTISGNLSQAIIANVSRNRYTLDGTLTLNGALTDSNGVLLKLMSGSTEIDSAVLDSGGAYLFLNVLADQYSYELELVDYTFVVSIPASNVVTVSGGATTQSVSATATINTYTVSGSLSVTGALTDPAGITLRLMDAGVPVGSTVLTSSGAFNFSGIEPGTYSFDVSRLDYTLSVSDPVGNTLVVTGGNAIQNVTLCSSLNAYDISGVVTLTGALTSTDGVILRLLDSSASVVASSTLSLSGAYLFEDLIPGAYSFELEAIYISFDITTPTGNSLALSGGDAIQPIIASTTTAAIYSISGSVFGDAYGDITIHCVGPLSVDTVTNIAGKYTLSGLADGEYRITPERVAYDFNPSFTFVTISASSVSAINFEATYLGNSTPEILNVTFDPDPVVNGNATHITVNAEDIDAGPQPMTYTWSRITGPGSINFIPNDSTNPEMTAVFSLSGTYAMELIVYDGAATVSEYRTIHVTLSASNMPPIVDAGNPQTIELPVTTVQTLATVIDPEDTPSLSWTLLSGPSTVVISDPNIEDPIITFSATGVYVLELTADDGVNAAVSDTVTMTVLPQPVASITVSYPNGGESIYRDQAITILWTSENYDGNIKIEYFSASTWHSIIDSHPNDGAYLWTVPYLGTVNVTGMLIRVSDSSSSVPSDESDASLTYVALQDSDGDSMDDVWEIGHFGDLSHDGTLDSDDDGLTDLEEFTHNTDPNNSDTDDDGMPDGWEAANGLLPNYIGDAVIDEEPDGLTNIEEYIAGTNPQNRDTDGDGLLDGVDDDPLVPRNKPSVRGGVIGDGCVLSSSISASPISAGLALLFILVLSLSLMRGQFIFNRK